MNKTLLTRPFFSEPNCIASASTPHTSLYDSTTLNYTSPYTSAYTDSSCIQSSPVAVVPSISSTSFDQVDYQSSSFFEPIYYTEVSSSQEYNVASSEKSVDDWVQYLHSDDEGTSFDDSLVINNIDTLFPEFDEEVRRYTVL